MKPLKQRIHDALAAGPRPYHAVLHEVFPDEQFPRAFRCSVNGGPPGCAMAFGRALREIGVYERTPAGAGRGILVLSR